MLKRGEHLRAYLRGDGSSLPRPIIELAMLVTARENNCQFIWNAHAAAGRAAGLNDDLVNNLRDRKDLSALSPQEQAVVEYGREFFRTRTVSQATFNAALAQFGTRGLAELTTLMGYYGAAGVQHKCLRGGDTRGPHGGSAAGLVSSIGIRTFCHCPV